MPIVQLDSTAVNSYTFFMSKEKSKKRLLGRRKLKNLFIDKGMQRRLGANIVAINFCVAGIGAYILMGYVTDLREALELIPSYSNDINEPLATALIGIVSTAIITIVAAAAVNYLAGIFLAHRFAGPTHIINESLDDMIAGKPMPKRELRPNDELKDIWAKLQQLDKKIRNETSVPQ